MPRTAPLPAQRRKPAEKPAAAPRAGARTKAASAESEAFHGQSAALAVGQTHPS